MSNLQMIPVNRLEHHPRNPRKEIGDVQELADSIRESGVLQNLTVVHHYGEITGQPTGFYWVVIGNRRLEACKLAGLAEVPCAVVEMTPEEQFRTMMVENMQRCDLTPLEEADGFQLMIDDWGATVESISRDTGLSQTTVRRRLSLGQLPTEAVRESMTRGGTLDDYLKVTKIKDPKRQEKALAAIGTVDFAAEVKKQLDVEKKAEYIKQLRKDIQLADWLIKLEDAPYADWEYVTQYGPWSPSRPLEKPEDAGSRVYGYTERTKDSYTIHRKKIKEGMDTKEDRMRQIRKRARDELDIITQDLGMEAEDYRDMREEFVQKFGRYDRHREEIQAMLCYAVIQADPLETDLEETLAELRLAVPMAEHLSRIGIYQLLLKAPDRAMLRLAYLLLEQDAGDPWWMAYNRTLQTSVPEPKKNTGLEVLYRLLAELGYGISKEEEAFLQGACMQYHEAKAVAEKYTQQIEEVINE